MRVKGAKILFGQCIIAICLILFVVTRAIGAEDPRKFPSKPVQLTIGWSPGGGTDISVRLLAKAAEKHLGQPIIIKSRPGGASAVALMENKKAKPDGYSLVALNAIAGCIIPHMRKVPYTAWEDFTPVMVYGEYVAMLVVLADRPWKTVDEFMQYGVKNPKAVTVGVSSIGASAHLAVEWLASKYDAKITFVPFGGGAPAVASLLGGHITASSTSGEVLPHVRAGKARILIAYSDYPIEGVGPVPSLPGKYGFDLSSWSGIAAPKGVPEPIVAKLDQAFKKAMEDANFIKGMKNLVMNQKYVDHKEMVATIVKDYEAWGNLVKKLKIGLYKK